MTRSSTASTDVDPQIEYQRRLTSARAVAVAVGQRQRWLSNLRLAVFAAGLAVGWFVFGVELVGPGWIVPPVLVFLALVIAHDQAIRARVRAERTADVYDHGLARLEDRWRGRGPEGNEFRDPAHPYAEDLDLFGEGSLFQLICTARTPAGAKRIADWLRAAATTSEIRERQMAVEELRERLDLREDLALLGEETSTRLDPAALVHWGGGLPAGVARAQRVTGAILALVSLATLSAWTFTGTGPVPFLFALAVQTGFAAYLRPRIRPILAAVERPTRDLSLLRELLARLEAEPMQSPRLVALHSSLETDGVPPSQRIAQLVRLVDLLDARRNQLFAPIAALLLWGTQLGLAIETWRARYGPELAGWLDAASEMEALCALAAYAYEHPRDPFPEIVEKGPLFDGRDLGHPLLPESSCIRNHLRLDGERRAFVVSGSNMSGKSTLLRTAGTNALLALAGAPVRASSLRLSPLTVAASIRVTDSLQDGISHFYAEILRLRQVVDLASDGPSVLFLLDEILHGTNSHDRRIGAAAVVRALIARGALGLVTTHGSSAVESWAGFANRRGPSRPSKKRRESSSDSSVAKYWTAQSTYSFE